MKERELYTVTSLQIHLFFLRLIKSSADFPAGKLLLWAAHLSNGIICFELPASRRFQAKYFDSASITLELSQEVKHLNQTVLKLLRQYMDTHKNDKNFLPETEKYYNLLFRLENGKLSDIFI